MSAAREIERQARRLHAAGCAVAAEVARRDESRGRSAGSAATRLGAELGVSRGAVLSRIAAGRREGTAGGSALAEGRITAGQERAVAAWVDELPIGTPPEARESFARHLTSLAEGGLGTRSLGVAAQRELMAIDPTWQARREVRQARNRAVRLMGEDAEGNSLVSITCDARLRALLDTAVATFGGPGQCVRVPADPETGELPDVAELAAADSRTAPQRAHDAIAHVLEAGLRSGPGSARGVASIVVRVTAEQLDAMGCAARGGDDADETGGRVLTDAGTPMSARQAIGMSRGHSWFVSALRDGREELRRIDVDGDGGSGRGTRRRLATRLQRLVLYAGGSGYWTHPGCDQPAARCQAHHVIEYSRGGPTTVMNLALVCPTHHGSIGDGPDRWRTVVDPARPGTPRWIPPDGTARADGRRAA